MPFTNTKTPTLAERLKANMMTPQEMMSAQSAIKQKEGLPIFGNGYAGNIADGFASSFARGFADMAKFLNFNGASNTLDKTAENIESYLKPAKPAATTLDYVFSPEGLARGSGNLTGSIASIALPTILTEGAAAGVTGAGIAARGGALLNRAFNLSPKVGTWATGSAMTAIPEAAMEGGGAIKNLTANGIPENQAREKSWDVFKDNVALFMECSAGRVVAEIIGARWNWRSIVGGGR